MAKVRAPPNRALAVAAIRIRLDEAKNDAEESAWPSSWPSMNRSLRWAMLAIQLARSTVMSVFSTLPRCCLAKARRSGA